MTDLMKYLILNFFVIFMVYKILSNRISKIEAGLFNSTGPVEIQFYQLMGGVKTKVDKVQAKVSDQIELSATAVDKFGNPTPMDGEIKFSVSDESLGSFDGAVFKPSGKVGSLELQASGDADLGEGVKTIFGKLQLDLLPGEAVEIQLSGKASPQE